MLQIIKNIWVFRGFNQLNFFYKPIDLHVGSHFRLLKKAYSVFVWEISQNGAIFLKKPLLLHSNERKKKIKKKKKERKKKNHSPENDVSFFFFLI